MNLLRNTLKKQYSQIPNELITDLSISSGELRVLLYLFTKPDDWSVYNKDICNQLGISEQTLTKYWKSLLKSKWLRREISSGSQGKFTGGYIYHIGNFTVSIESTETVKSIEHSNNKPLNKDLTNTNTKVTPLKIVNYLLKKIIENKPNFSYGISTLERWTDDIDKAIRIDKRTETELIGAIDWIYSTDKGSFWIPNIMSGKKLREKFDTMEAQMMQTNHKNIQSQNNLKIIEDMYNAG